MPYPRSSSTHSHFSLSPQSSTDDLLTQNLKKQQSRATLMQFLEKQKEEKENTERNRRDMERKRDLEDIERWKNELQREKRREVQEKLQKRAIRVQLEREYLQEYQSRVAKAVSERAAEVAQVKRLMRQAESEAKRQNAIKSGFRNMFQHLIRVNELQKEQTIRGFEEERKKDVEMQRKLIEKLKLQEEERENERKERVRKQQEFLLGEKRGEGKVEDQKMYKEVLDRQVREHRQRMDKDWRLMHETGSRRGK